MYIPTLNAKISRKVLQTRIWIQIRIRKDPRAGSGSEMTLQVGSGSGSRSGSRSEINSFGSATLVISDHYYGNDDNIDDSGDRDDDDDSDDKCSKGDDCDDDDVDDQMNMTTMMIEEELNRALQVMPTMINDFKFSEKIHVTRTESKIKNLEYTYQFDLKSGVVCWLWMTPSY